MNITFDNDGVQVVIYKSESYEAFSVYEDEEVEVEGYGKMLPKVLKKAIEIGMGVLNEKQVADEKAN